MDSIDLRSDTVTQPTPAMREAMATPRLAMTSSATTPPSTGCRSWQPAGWAKRPDCSSPPGRWATWPRSWRIAPGGTRRILGDKAHTVLYEAGGISALGGVHSRQVANQPDGTLRLEDIEAAIRTDDAHHPISRLVALENTHNRCGGVALTPAYTQAVGELAHQHGLLLHLDGARIFNAAVVQGVTARELAEPADSVTFCLSKGLSAPVGSVICGSREFIYRAHRMRKMLGGGMRQAGILAAAGIVALETMVERLADDHRRARMLAEGLKEIPGIALDPGTPYTNMVFLNLSEEVAPAAELAGITPAKWIAEQLDAQGVKTSTVGPRRFRLVTHYWIEDEDVGQAVEAFRRAALKS